MSVRNGLWCTLGMAVLALVAVTLGCKAMHEYDYYDNVQKSGLSTGQPTDAPRIMQQMRTANLKLVDSLIYMNGEGIMANSVQMYELARALKKTQPAVAMQAPDDVAKFKKLADDLAEIIVQVGSSARDNRMDLADWYYAQAFPLCNRCHVQFRNVTTPQPLTIPEIEKPAPTAPATEGTAPTPKGAAAPPAPLPAAGTK